MAPCSHERQFTDSFDLLEESVVNADRYAEMRSLEQLDEQLAVLSDAEKIAFGEALSRCAGREVSIQSKRSGNT